MKLIARVPSPLVKAALLFQGKADIRQYINGVHLAPEFVAATCGHTMFIADYESDVRPSEPLIVSIKGKLPTKGSLLEFMYDEDSKIGFIRTVGDYFGELQPIQDVMGHDVLVQFSLIEGRAVEFDRVLPKGDLVPVAQIGINFNYADRVAKAAKILGSKHSSCAMNFRGASSSIEIELRNPFFKDARVIIMPMRL